MGRPSIDPQLMIRMLVIGYCLGILSERRLCEEVHLWPIAGPAALAWMECRLGIREQGSEIQRAAVYDIVVGRLTAISKKLNRIGLGFGRRGNCVRGKVRGVLGSRWRI